MNLCEIFTGKKASSTLVVALAALKQSELGRIVHHGELFQQRLDDFPGRGAGTDVQELGRVLGQVERGAALHCAALLRCALAAFLWWRDRHWACQLELHLHEAGVGAVLVLSVGKSVFVSKNGLFSEKQKSFLNY